MNGLARSSVLLLLLLGVSSCRDHGVGLFPPGTGTWVATEPIQCLGNPWERDWLARHGNDYGSYPRDPAGQNAVIVEYYGRLGIEVRDIISIVKYPVTCDACSCPRGDTLYLLVPERKAGEMTELGFRLESPPPFP